MHKTDTRLMSKIAIYFSAQRGCKELISPKTKKVSAKSFCSE